MSPEFWTVLGKARAIVLIWWWLSRDIQKEQGLVRVQNNAAHLKVESEKYNQETGKWLLFCLLEMLNPWREKPVLLCFHNSKWASQALNRGKPSERSSWKRYHQSVSSQHVMNAVYVSNVNA